MVRIRPVRHIKIGTYHTPLVIVTERVYKGLGWGGIQFNSASSKEKRTTSYLSNGPQTFGSTTATYIYD